MPKSVTKVVYKPDTQSTDEYMIIVNSGEVTVCVLMPDGAISDLRDVAVQEMEVWR